jgi:hypothetical protein
MEGRELAQIESAGWEVTVKINFGLLKEDSDCRRHKSSREIPMKTATRHAAYLLDIYVYKVPVLSV